MGKICGKWGFTRNFNSYHIARYVKGIYSYHASVPQMVNELKWESLESRREQLSLTMLCNKMSIYHLNTYPSFICRHHSTRYRPDHAICSDSLNHFVTLTPTSTPLYHQHQGNGTYYIATSLKWKTLTYSNLCYVTIILQSIANIIYYIISVYIPLFVKFSQ